MIPQMLEVQESDIEAKLAHDELLVYLTPAREKNKSTWVNGRASERVAHLSGKLYYLNYDIGFFPGNGCPWVVLTWDHLGASALERRWVAQKFWVKLAQQFNIKKIVCYFPAGSQTDDFVLAEDLTTRSMTALYQSAKIEMRMFTPDPGALQALTSHYSARFAGQLRFRQWVNENPDSLTSLELGARLKGFCHKHQLGFEELDEKQLAALGLNLLVAVGQASQRSPSRLFIATSRLKENPNKKPLMLIGKGITFDTGGINLKPHESFVNCMKNDMGGAGLMVNLFMALVESRYSGPLVLVIPACENLIAERSVKPGAIIKSYAGKDVIIEHTDAEGRLILADAMHYAQKIYQPGLSIIAATLTTASLRQFANYFTPIHFASPEVQTAISAAAKAWGEEVTFWGDFLPFREGNKSEAADLTNMGRLASHASMGGGSNVAAHFLREFTLGPLVHIDIFASTWNWSGDYPGAHYGATGALFNTLFSAILEHHLY